MRAVPIQTRRVRRLVRRRQRRSRATGRVVGVVARFRRSRRSRFLTNRVFRASRAAPSSKDVQQRRARRGDERRRSSELAFSRAKKRREERARRRESAPNGSRRFERGRDDEGHLRHSRDAPRAERRLIAAIRDPDERRHRDGDYSARGCGRRTPRGALRGGARHAAQRRDERFRVRLERRARALPAAPPRRHGEEHLRALRGRRRRRGEGPTSVRIFRVRGDTVRAGDITKKILPSSEGSDATRGGVGGSQTVDDGAIRRADESFPGASRQRREAPFERPLEARARWNVRRRGRRGRPERRRPPSRAARRGGVATSGVVRREDDGDERGVRGGR